MNNLQLFCYSFIYFNLEHCHTYKDNNILFQTYILYETYTEELFDIVECMLRYTTLTKKRKLIICIRYRDEWPYREDCSLDYIRLEIVKEKVDSNNVIWKR